MDAPDRAGPDFSFLDALGVQVCPGRTVTSLGPRGRVDTRDGTRRFDGIVVATGTRGRWVPFRGSGKKGVYVLSGPADYIGLARNREAIDRVVVSGNGLPTLRLAERLLAGGSRVTLLVQNPGRDHLSPVLREIVRNRAVEAGAVIRDLGLERAVGSGSLEAVIAGGTVSTCDGLAVVPDRIPEFPPGAPQVGPYGGLLIDSSMRSNAIGTYAAGGCAEMASADGPRSSPLADSPVASGRVAGANSSGRARYLRGVGTFRAELFGLTFEGAGLALDDAKKCALDALETTICEGPSSACSLVYLRKTCRVIGGQLAGRRNSGASAVISAFVSQRADLDTLAYSDIGGSTDISLLQETARQGLNSVW